MNKNFYIWVKILGVKVKVFLREHVKPVLLFAVIPLKLWLN